MAGLGLVEFEETCPMPALIGWQAAEAACDWPRPDTNITTSQTEFSSSRLGTGQQARLQLSSGRLLQAGTGEDQGRGGGRGAGKVQGGWGRDLALFTASWFGSWLRTYQLTLGAGLNLFYDLNTGFIWSIS